MSKLEKERAFLQHRARCARLINSAVPEARGAEANWDLLYSPATAQYYSSAICSLCGTQMTMRLTNPVKKASFPGHRDPAGKICLGGGYPLKDKPRDVRCRCCGKLTGYYLMIVGQDRRISPLHHYRLNSDELCSNNITFPFDIVGGKLVRR